MIRSDHPPGRVISPGPFRPGSTPCARYLPVYGDGLNVRDWLYVEDHCRGIEQTLRWYLEHRDWCARVRSGDYRHYYQRQYG